MSLTNSIHTNPYPGWKNYEKAALRFFVIYFVIQVIPLDWKFYRELFSLQWNVYDLFSLTKYSPQFFSLTGYANWIVAALIAAIGTVAWINIERKELNYDHAYY